MADKQIKILLTGKDELTQTLESAGKSMDSFGKKAESIGRNFEQVGTRLAGIGVAGQAGLSRLGLDMNTLVAGAVDAEKALYGIANTAGISGEKAKAAVSEWTLAINQIAQATNQSQANVTQAFSDMIAKGLDPRAAVQMLKPIGQAATAAGAEIGDMAAAAQASFDKLKIPVDGVSKSLDIMAQAGKAGAFELRDMAGYFDKISASAANLGMSGQESLAGLTAAAQIARRGTGDAAQAATNLDNFLSKLNAQVTYKAFDKMGVDLGKLKEEAKASGDYLGYMADAVQKLTGGDTAKVSALFSDIQAGAFIQGMLRDLDDYKKIRTEALAANGVAAQDFATAMQSSAAQIDQFKISASAAVNNGEGMKSILSTMTSIANWANENPELAKWLIFGTAGLAIGGVALTGIGAMITAITGIGTALGTLATFLAANPVVLTILGVAAAGAAAGAAGYAIGNYLGLDEIGKKLGSFTYDVVQTLGKLPDELSAMWERWKAAGAGLVQSMRDGITERLKGGLGIGDKLKDAVKYVTDQGGEWLKVGKDIMQGLLNGIQAKYKEIIAKIKGLGSDMLDSVKDVLGIRSPSKAFEQVGLYVAEGMTLGINKGTLGVQRSIEDLARTALAAGYDLKSYGDPFGDLAEDIEAIAKAAEKAEKSIAKAAPKIDAIAKASQRKDSKGRFLPAAEAAATAEEFRRAAEDIERSLTDALMRGFEGGKDIGKNFVDTIKNYLKSQFLKPIAVKISASVMGAIGLGGSTAALASGTGGASSSILSMGSAIANGLAPGAMSFAIGEGVAAGLSAFGASTGVATGIGSFVSSAIPVIGWIAAIAGLVKAFSTGGTPHLGTTREFGLSGGNSIVSIDDWRAAGGDSTGLPGWLYGEGDKSPYNDAVSAFGAQMVAAINTDMKLLGGTLGKDFALQFGFAAENEAETASGGFARVMLGGENVLDIYKRYAKDGKTGIEQYMKEVAPKVELVAIQLAEGLSPALAEMADSLDASTASVGSITELLGELNAAANALNLQSVFADLNLTLGQTDTQIIATGLALRDLAGGFDALNAGATAYYQSFFSEAEQIANLSESLSSEFGKLSLALPASKEAFRSLVESLDMTTSAGQSAFVTLMGLAPSFATLADYAETSAQAVAEVANSLDAAFDALTRAVNAERGRINSVFDGLAQSLSAAVDELEDRISRKTGLSDALQTALDGLLQTAGLSMSRAVADAQVQAALLIAKTGNVLPDVATLQPALDALGQDNRSQYATRTDYLRDQMRSAAALDNLKKLTDTQLSTDELALAALNTQIDENLRWKNDELAKLDSLIDQAKMQVDAAKGINTAVLSLADALAELNALTGKTTTTAAKPATGNVVVGGGASASAASAGYAYGIGTSLIMPAAPSQMAKLDSINQFLTSTYDGGTAAWFEDVYAYAKENGVRQSDIAAALNLPLSDVEQAAAAMGYPKFAAGGRYAGGMALVGEQGPELINFDGGGYIHTAPKTAAMIGNGNAALIEEIIALREEVSMLRAETRATAQHTGKTARLLERAMPDGDALSTREAT